MAGGASEAPQPPATEGAGLFSSLADEPQAHKMYEANGACDDSLVRPRGCMTAQRVKSQCLVAVEM